MEKLLCFWKFGRKFLPCSSIALATLGNSRINGAFRLHDCHCISMFDYGTFDDRAVIRSYCGPSMGFFSTMAGPLLVQAKDPAGLSFLLESAIDERRYEDAWKLYEQHLHMDGFPRKSVLNKLLAGLGQTNDCQWLDKACNCIEMVFVENRFELLDKECLLYLSFVLAKCDMVVPASTILRKLIENEETVAVSAWSGILGHISRNPYGAYLAADLIVEIGHLFKDNMVDPRKKSNRPLLSMKPNTAVFNLVLASCLLYRTARKAEELLELMPRVGVKANSTSLIIMVHIHERNGRKEEIKKLKRYIDEASDLRDYHYQQYYNCSLSCHLKLGDLTTASEMILDMLRKEREAKSSLGAATVALQTVISEDSSTCKQSAECKTDTAQSQNFCKLAEGPLPCFEEFIKDKKFSRLESQTDEILADLLLKLQADVELVSLKNGILHPTEKLYAKLVTAFLKAEKVKDLADFLVRAKQEEPLVATEKSTVVHVIDACISLGWLDQAHDLLDEMRFSGVRTGSAVYSSLLKAYCKENRHKEAQSLLKDAQKAGVQLDSSCYAALIDARVVNKDTQGALHLFKEMKAAKLPKDSNSEFAKLVKGCEERGEATFMTKLLEEIKEGQRVDSGVHDWNNVIHFFCKKKLMNDAEKALRKMKALGHQPNAQTFHSLVTAYASLGGKYVEVTELWGEMKVLYSSSSIKFDQELLDALLYTFVRGGFFLRANEVVTLMEENDLFIDKYKYRTLFLKYHKTLYKGKAPKFQTEAQMKRREAALLFKKWVGLN